MNLRDQIGDDSEMTIIANFIISCSNNKISVVEFTIFIINMLEDTKTFPNFIAQMKDFVNDNTIKWKMFETMGSFQSQ